MASTIWKIRGIDTQGADLALSHIVPWSAGGALTPISITSTFAPVSGSLPGLLVDDASGCVFAAKDVAKPGFAIEVAFSSAVTLWGFRFAGPSAATWLLQHSVVSGDLAGSATRVQWIAGALSPAPTKPLSLTQTQNTWEARSAAGTRNWYGIAVSGDGLTMLGGAEAGNLWLSKDGGDSWVAQTAAGTRNWYGCAASSDGQVLLAGANGGNIWLSKDGGATWIAQTTPGTGGWQSCGASSDGQVLLVSQTGLLWLSIDGGTTWAAQTTPGSRAWRGCAVSGDGLVLLANANGGRPWLSKDKGVTWVEQTAPGSRTWYGAAASSDGQVLLAAANGGSLWLSKDKGVTWVEQIAAGSRGWYGAAASADGQVLLAAPDGADLWASTDGGLTWASQGSSGSRNWYGCALSADGQTHIAAVYNAGGLYRFITPDAIYLPTPVSLKTAAPILTVAGLAPDAQGSLRTAAAVGVQVVDTEFGGNGRVYGTVERKNAPANVPMRRRVRLHRSRDGLLVRETWSKVDGSYEFKGVSMKYEYDTVAWDHEMSYRSVVANNLKPEAM